LREDLDRYSDGKPRSTKLFSAIFTEQADLAEPVSLVTTQFEFNKLVIVSLLNCVLVKSFQENFCQIAHGRAAGTPFLITFLW
jgi:hypothetical protein